MTADLLFLGLGLLIGFGTGWLCHRSRQIARRELAEQHAASVEKELTRVQIENAKGSERIRMLEEAQHNLQAELAQERQFNISLHAELSRERTNRNHLDQRLELQKNDLLQLQQRLSHEIRLLVQQVLEEKSQSLSDLNKNNLNTLIQPITEKLHEFKQKVEEQHYRETRELIVLHNKIDHLESSRWPHSNGSGTHIKEVEQPPVAAPDNAGSQYIPPALEPAAPANGSAVKAEQVPESEPAVNEEVHEVEEVRPFLPKQQVEIDNFLKRTLGRAQRKKAG